MGFHGWKLKKFTIDNLEMKMVTQAEAEELAKKVIQLYLDECGLITQKDAGNALMKLCSVAGVMMVATVGYDDAVSRMKGTASFIETKMAPAKNSSFMQRKVN